MTNNGGWQPACPMDVLAKRAEMLRQIRLFFADRHVMEVDTPLLCSTTATDPHLASIAVPLPEGGTRFLQTSPEFPMKRLLAAGSGAIYQIAHAFRQGERGQRHNPEFSMLEWYRPGMSEFDLMDEVEALVAVAGVKLPVHRYSYQALFQTFAGLDPFAETDARLTRQAMALSGLSESDVTDRDVALDVILTHGIEPEINALGLVFVYHFPASQAALAKVTEVAGLRVAQRFELYVRGMELANGYNELVDGDEQQARFEMDVARRSTLGLPPVPVDERLCSALRAGLPACAGVAMGLDRLLMAVADASRIEDVLAFPFESV